MIIIKILLNKNNINQQVFYLAGYKFNTQKALMRTKKVKYYSIKTNYIMKICLSNLAKMNYKIASC